MSQFYEVEDIQPTKLDEYKGSTWYSVKFRGVADNALWLAQKRPDPNGKVYGHIERTASGKGWRFKRDPVPEEEGNLLVPEGPEPPRVQHVLKSDQLDRIEAKLDKLLGIDEELSSKEESKTELTKEPLPEFPGEPDYGDDYEG